MKTRFRFCLAIAIQVALSLGLGGLPVGAEPQDPWQRWLCLSGAQAEPFEFKPEQQPAALPSLESPAFPLPSRAIVSSDFGWRVHPVTGLDNFHQGLDFAVPAGTPILAAFSGRVVSAGPLGNLGNAVVLEHEGDRRTRYGHMSAIAVTANTSVTRGQLIGYVGSTGRSTGPHLHFEVWQKGPNGTWVASNPQPYLSDGASSYRTTSASLAPVALGGGSHSSC